ncbi:MAG: UDP-N-acetylmuramoyl-L-alanyl-D-glutamate--2,6-diaminopimelate ligase [Coriobacteriales bacterium]|nr:UDP-N-acetylmuramoyl-L-alanyl-D-glutamate--2,6-diaminopimelate ligase [Coriobacteriales bacterium]
MPSCKESELVNYLAAFSASDLLLNNNLVHCSDVSRVTNETVTGISYDSRAIKPGYLFFCKGERFNKSYLTQAIKAGAIAYVSEQSYEAAFLGLSEEQMIPGIVVSDIRQAMPVACQVAFPGIADQLKLVAVTGTKGKSTTVYMLKSILDEWLKSEGKMPAALLSGIQNFNGKESVVSRLTTEETFDIYSYMQAAVANGCEYLVMEVSSQALKYHRVQGLHFTIGAFLNFSRDHIGPIEHPDMKDYLVSKLALATQCDCMVLGAELNDEIITRAKDSFVGDNLVLVSGSIKGYNISLAGEMNAQNALSAITIAQSLNIPDEFIKAGLAQVRVPGRMETFVASWGAVIIVDYAHNGTSLELLLQLVHKQYPKRRVSLVFGCPGGKAPNRPAEMGAIAGKLADDVILTEDDPYKKPVVLICDEIAKALSDAAVLAGRVVPKTRTIEDRTVAIHTAIDASDAMTVVVVAGKGHENRQLRASGSVPIMTDSGVVAQYLAKKS